MSYYEYNDMFIKCQETGPYKMYTYDVKDSKKLNDNLLTQKLYSLICLVRYKIHLIEETTDEKILYDGDDLYYIEDGSLPNITNLNDSEPLLLGDAIAFTIYNGSIEDNIVDALFESAKTELNIKYSFHKEVGCYETNSWIEGKNKYFRGYCFLYLTNKHK